MDISTNYSEILDNTEEDISESHSKLLEAVSQLDKGQRVKKAERSEPTLEVSEFHLVKSGISDQDVVQVHDLAKALGKKGHYLEITKTLKATKEKLRVLPKPLEKPAADRIKRIVGFENTTQELKKWNAVVTRNRTAESLHFPLNQSSMRLESSNKFVTRFRLQSDLEKELAALEPQKENIEEKSDEFSLTLNEIIMKRKEAARIRAQQSYKEAKARRQNKIKSKKFHRVQRKEKIKLQLKEFEELQKTNPEAALEKLEQLNKTRAEERMSLRHKNTGKWAKSKQIRAKYDKETRQELAQQLSISRDLTQKLKKSSDSEDEENEGDNISVQPLTSDKENPWIKNTKTESEVDKFVESYRKYWNTAQNDESKNKNLNISIKNTIENKQMNNSLKDTQFCGVLNDKSTDVNVKSSEIQNSERIPEMANFSKDDNTTYNMQSVNIDNHKKNVEMIKSNVESIKNNSYDKTTQKTELDNSKRSNKKNNLYKTNLSNVIATSNWHVESIENINVKNVINSLSSNTSNNEKINKIFDFIEEKIQDQIKSKFERITQDYSKMEIKKNRKRESVEFKEDNFDGLEIQPNRKKPILDLGLNENVSNNNSEFNNELETAKYLKHDNISSTDRLNASNIEIDPNKYINVKPKYLNTDLPADITNGDDVLDDVEEEEEKHNLVSEAFADDDVVEEFRKEKEEQVKKFKPKDIDLTLPGWGSWGGKNIKKSKRKKRRFILKMPKDLPRKDENKGDVIIFEDDSKIKEHQVNELPYPFSSIKDYEASVRMPIGRNFVPENSHRKLIAPAVETRMGKIIEPMSEDILVKKEDKKRRKSNLNKKNRIIKKKGKISKKIN